MGEPWEEFPKDPLVTDLRAIIAAGLYSFDIAKLKALPDLLGVENTAELRDLLLPLLMADDPGKQPSDPDLGEATQVTLALFRATSDTKMKTLDGAREVVGRIVRPGVGMSTDGVRRHPTKSQPKGGVEWRVILAVHERVLEYAAAAATEDELVNEAELPAEGPDTQVDMSPLYKRSEPDELKEDFFDRDSTNHYLNILQVSGPTTIYAGAGVSADLGAPMGDALMRYLLEYWVRHHDDLEDIDVPPELQQAPKHGAELLNPESSAVESVVGAIRVAYPPSYLGSIVRMLVEAERKPGENPDSKLATRIRAAIKRGHTGGGFLARSIGALAFALKHTGSPVQIVTTNYDQALLREEAKVRTYFKKYFENCKAQLTPRRSRSEGVLRDHEIPIYYINGIGPDNEDERLDPPILGEAEFFTPGLHGAQAAQGYKEWREATLNYALTKTTCLFVGSSLTDPDVLAALAATRGQRPRYAILLAPDRELIADGMTRVSLAQESGIPNVERSIARDLVCQRFLHLGVLPIMVDHPYQVPQLLTEVALKTVDSEYIDYNRRLTDWWDDCAEDFGFADRKHAGKRSESAQRDWQKGLEKLKEKVAEKVGLRPGSAERILVEVWVRNPDLHELFLWATSESLWLHGDTAHQCGIEEQGSRFAVQRVFRAGHNKSGLIRPVRGQWSFHASVPLTLQSKPYHHLPVGVVSVLSSQAKGGKLFSHAKNPAKMEKLGDLLKGEVNNLLDPRPRSTQAD